MNRLDVPTQKNPAPKTGDRRNIENLAPAVEKARKAPSMKKFNVLIVDDDFVFVGPLKRNIEKRYGNRINNLCMINNFVQATRLLQKHRFDLVIVDMHRGPGQKTGLVITELAKKENKDCCVIGMGSNKSTRKLFLKFGADDFIKKGGSLEYGNRIIDIFFNKK